MGGQGETPGQGEAPAEVNPQRPQVPAPGALIPGAPARVPGEEKAPEPEITITLDDPRDRYSSCLVEGANAEGSDVNGEYRYVDHGESSPRVWRPKQGDWERLCGNRPWYLSSTASYIHYDEENGGWWIKDREDNCIYFNNSPAAALSSAELLNGWIPASLVTETHGFPVPKPLQEKRMHLPGPAPGTKFPPTITVSRVDTDTTITCINVSAPSGYDFAGQYRSSDTGSTQPPGRG